jgi:hypothetical protein
MGMAAAAPFTQAEVRNAPEPDNFEFFIRVSASFFPISYEQLNKQIFCVVQMEKCFYGGV